MSRRHPIVISDSDEEEEVKPVARRQRRRRRIVEPKEEEEQVIIMEDSEEKEEQRPKRRQRTIVLDEARDEAERLAQEAMDPDLTESETEPEPRRRRRAIVYDEEKDAIERQMEEADREAQRAAERARKAAEKARDAAEKARQAKADAKREKSEKSEKKAEKAQHKAEEAKAKAKHAKVEAGKTEKAAVNKEAVVRLLVSDSAEQVCNRWSITLTDADIKARHQLVRAHILDKFPDSTKQIKWSEEFVKRAVEALDMYYFDGQLRMRLRVKSIKVEFVESHTKHWGHCQRKGACHYVIALSERLSTGIFQKGEQKAYTVNGLTVHNGLDYLLSVLEHELIHLIVLAFCPEEPKRLRTGKVRRQSHGPVFRAIARATFGFTKITGHGLDEEERTEKVEKGKQKIAEMQQLGPGTLIYSPPSGKKWKGGHLVIISMHRTKMTATHLRNGRSFKLDMRNATLRVIAHSDLNEHEKRALQLAYAQHPTLPRSSSSS